MKVGSSLCSSPLHKQRKVAIPGIAGLALYFALLDNNSGTSAVEGKIGGAPKAVFLSRLFLRFMPLMKWGEL